SKLNRNKDDVNLDLYDVKSDVKVSVEVDTRLLSEDGRNQIKEDVMIVDTVNEIITNDTVGITDFFSNTNQEVKTYEGVKEVISKDPKLVALLNDKNITDSQKEMMMNKITDSVMLKLGYKDNKPKNKIIDTKTPGRDNKQIKGFHSIQTNDSYINKKYVKDNEDLIKTAGTEMQRAIDSNEGSKFDQSKEYRNERAKYSQHKGDNVVKYTNFALDITNQGSISNEINTYKTPRVTKTNSVFNNTSIVSANNTEFDGLDKKKGDNFAPLVAVGVVALANYLNAPEDEKSEIKQGPTDASYLIPGSLGIKALSTFGIKTLTKGSLITGGISGSIDATVQGVEMAFDQTKDYNVRDTAVSVGMGMTGNTLINVVNSGKKISTAGKIVYGIGVDSVVSATSQHLKTGNVEVKNILIDVAVGQGGNKISQLAKTKIENSKNMKVVDMFLDRQQRKINKGSTQTRINILNEVKDAKNKKITTSVLRTTSTSTGIASVMVNKAVDYYDKIEESNEK
ncbi:MAG: hypothetical protein HRT40_13445, partial [Campylobacteraceae bacterium]|nr:hypothetical protein [Campylobacteraceae bacterium]